MKIFLSILGGLAVVICLVLAFGYWVIIGSPMPSIAPRKTPPPEGFVAEAFQDIRALQSAGGLEVIDLNEHGKYFEGLFQRKDGLIWFTFFVPENTTRYAAYSNAGDLIGTLDLERRASTLDQFFLTEEGYYVLSADGFSAEMPYKQIEGDITAERLEQLNKDSDYYITFSWTGAPRDSETFKTKATQHVMQVDGVWWTLNTSIEQPHDYKGGAYGIGPDFELQTQYAHDPARPRSNPAWPTEKATLTLTHFDQQEYFARRSAPMGSTTGIGRAEHWRGTGYYTVTMGDGSLMFKIDRDTQNLRGSGTVHLTAATHEDVDYMLVTHRYRGQDQRAFLIRPAAQ